MKFLPCFLVATLASTFVSPAVGETPVRRCYVEAYRNPHESGRLLAYRLNFDSVPPVCRDLDLDAARDQVRAALSAKGMFEVPRRARADVEVSIAVAMWEQIFPGKPSFLRFRPVTEAERVVSREEVGDDGQMHLVREAMLVPLNHGLGPAQEKIGEVRIYEKRLSISARKMATNRPAARMVEVWRVEVATRDDAEDIAAALPFMLSAAMDRIDTSTAGREEVVVAATDRAVQFVTAGW